MNISFLIFYIIPFCCSFQNKFYWKQAKANSRVEVTILGATKDNEALTIDTVKKVGIL